MVMMTNQEQGRYRGRALASCALVYLLALPAAAQTIDASGFGVTFGSADYQLIGTGVGSGLRAPRLVGPTQIEATATLAPRHELRFSTWAVGGLDVLPGISFATLTTDPALRLDPARATYRYTFLERHDWAWKLGLSANLGGSLRSGLGLSDRLRFGSLPLLHFAGEGHFTPRWGLAFAAEGLATPRGRTLDLGVRVNYSLNQNFLLFGSYRLTDSAGDAEDFYGAGVSNAANFGLRYRF
jgi:hypothetical protein